MVGGVPIAHGVISYANWRALGYYNGVSYQHRAWINAEGTPAGGGQLQGVNQSIPKGWGGVQGVIYRNGTPCASSSVGYNSVPVTILANSTTKNCGAGTYFAMTYSHMWDGYRYQIVSYTSPTQTK